MQSFSRNGGLYYHMQHRLHNMHLVCPLFGMVRARKNRGLQTIQVNTFVELTGNRKEKIYRKYVQIIITVDRGTSQSVILLCHRFSLRRGSSGVLSNIMQTWVSQCNYNHDACRDIDTYRFIHSQNNFIEGIWYDKVKKFDANRVKQPFEMQVETDNYTQIVWAKTTEIGCGFTRYKNNQWNTNYLVCNYDPAGNIRNESTYEIAN
ncbi:Venom allergen 5 [Atta colombica]|uniref:Venom allergen 5 n=1 Tax=Atta colombica TaxID=520822 RepID=A0A195BEV4_9HYME|nr:Venom allergen 5 [Atta colombica]